MNSKSPVIFLVEVIDDSDNRRKTTPDSDRSIHAVSGLGAGKNDLLIYCSAGFAVLLFIAYLTFIDTDKPVIIIEGSSMVPNINSGDIVLLHRQHLGEVQIGDVIAFKKQIIDGYGPSNPIVVHRIVDKQTGEDGQTLLTTRGDFNLENDDEFTDEKNYIGKVYGVIPKAGFVAKGLQNPAIMGMLAVVIVGILFMLLKRRGI